MVLDRKPRSYWSIVLAIGLSFAPLGHAQEQVPPSEEEAPNEQSPAETIPLPVPIQIIEDDASARSREEREAEARQREIEDLAAQEGMNIAAQAMNEATQRMAELAKDQVDLARWQARLAVIGTSALILTLALMWDANRATRQVAKQQTRAYLSVTKAELHLDSKTYLGGELPDINVFIHIHNSGITPAVNISYHCFSEVSVWKDSDKFSCTETVQYHTYTNIVPSGETNRVKTICFGVLRDYREVIKRWGGFTNQTPIGLAPILVIKGVLFYEDVFGDTFRSDFGFWLEDKPGDGKPPEVWENLPPMQGRIPAFVRIRNRQRLIDPPKDEDGGNSA